MRPDWPRSSIRPRQRRWNSVVADREHFVDEQNFRLQVRCNGECEPDGHPARVALDRRIDELLDTSELDDLAKLALDLTALHSEDHAVEEDVLPTRELRMEPGTDFEQTSDPTRISARPAVGVVIRVRIFEVSTCPRHCVR